MNGYMNVHPKKSHGERLRQTTKWRCMFCRFPTDATRRSNVGSDTITDGNTITIVNGLVTDVIATSGCSFCGCLHWSNKIPRVIRRPEDRPHIPGFKSFPRYMPGF